MFFAKLKRPTFTESNLYFDNYQYVIDTFNPEVETLCIIPFHVHGKTYAARKESARQLAIDFQNCEDGSADINLSYRELSYIQGFFERVGKKYGLLREFRENAIC